MPELLFLLGAGALVFLGIRYAERWDDRAIREREEAIAEVWTEAMRQVALTALDVSRTIREQVVPAAEQMGNAFEEFVAAWQRGNERTAEKFLENLRREL